MLKSERKIVVNPYREGTPTRELRSTRGTAFPAKERSGKACLREGSAADRGIVKVVEAVWKHDTGPKLLGL